MSTPLSEISGTLSTHQQVSSDFDEIRAMTRSKDGTTPSWLAPARAVQAALETVEFKVTMSIRATLGGALSTLIAAL